jgi:hypothetical protein
MSMLAEILRFIVFVGFGLIAITSLAVLISIVRRGPAGIADLVRQGVGFQAWASGGIPESHDGTSIDLIEGIEISARGRTLVSARQTRGISAEH